MIVCFAGGTYGDIVTVILDSKNCKLDPDGLIVLPDDRMKLKKPHLFLNAKEKNNYIEQMNKKYLSIPSHDLDFHLQNNHNFLGVVCEDKNLRLKASRRFKILHPEYVWKEMQNVSNSNSIEQYANDILEMSKKIIKSDNQYLDVDDILSGNLIKIMERKNNIKISEENKNLYKDWLKLQ